MFKRNKALALVLAVALPVFVIFFAKWYIGVMNLSREKNRPHAPAKMFAEGVQEVTNPNGTKEIDSVYHTIPDLKLETQSGDSLDLDSLRGSIYVADFFYATCPGICPRLSNSLERVQQGFIRDNNVKIVSFSVDPAKDSVQALRAYAERHDAIPGKWYFLRGSKQDIFDLAKNGFSITAKDDEDGGPEAFIHSEKLVLVDQSGNIRGYYSGVDSTRVNKLMGDIVLLLKETEDGFSFDKKNTKAK